MKKLIGALFLMVASGCNAVVYYVPGDLVTELKPAQCAGLLNFDEFEALRKRSSKLIREAGRTDDVDRIRALAAELDAIVVKMKSTVKEEFSREDYKGTYRWTMMKPRILRMINPRMQPVVLSTNGREVPVNLMSGIDTRELYYFEWEKPMSLLEYCTLSDSTMALIELRGSWPRSVSYIRLGFEKEDPEAKGSTWPQNVIRADGSRSIR